jgi:hypothetical protein
VTGTAVQVSPHGPGLNSMQDALAATLAAPKIAGTLILRRLRLSGCRRLLDELADRGVATLRSAGSPGTTGDGQAQGKGRLISIR